MAEKNLSVAVKGLVYGGVKVCGLTKPEHANSAFTAGASYGGLIFAEKSPRYVTPEVALAIVDEVPGHYVGVFVDKPIDEVVEIASKLSLRAVQLHGSEDASYHEQLSGRLPANCAIWQAVGVTDTIPSTVYSLLDDKHVQRVLLDCQVGNNKGGTGQQFDWSLLKDIDKKEKLIIAGGIHPDNIADAIATGCGMIDVNSGVETAPGEKSADKLTALFTICRRY
tara:strand:- start:52 stop:723 length:672 start_codon:yes stop_codon:yes gene_type:complete